GDEGRVTLPMRIGVRNASAVASIFFVAGPALSVAPMIWQSYGVLYYLVLIADALFVYCAYIVFSSPHKAQSTAKKAMFVALIAFILGVAF
ncbi:MAG: 4-hydroxybenzoate polyprenyltransferase, partial [Candidatus Methanomethylophilaceae archaeon]|nr:4-hydroxybenzoate polyprenyltransferase [Candidatus Methanomethylophilaceae archaeon]